MDKNSRKGETLNLRQDCMKRPEWFTIYDKSAHMYFMELKQVRVCPRRASVVYNADEQDTLITESVRGCD